MCVSSDSPEEQAYATWDEVEAEKQFAGCYEKLKIKGRTEVDHQIQIKRIDH